MGLGSYGLKQLFSYKVPYSLISRKWNVWQKIQFKISFPSFLFYFKALNGLRPEYICDLFVCYEASRRLRSCGMELLSALQIKPDKVKQLEVSMLLTCGTSFLNT